jgi:uncharacterized membrane protein
MTTDAPATLLLRPSRIKNLLLLAVSAAFTVGGATMIRNSRSMGWFVLVFFGLCIALAVPIAIRLIGRQRRAW